MTYPAVRILEVTESVPDALGLRQLHTGQPPPNLSRDTEKDQQTTIYTYRQ